MHTEITLKNSSHLPPCCPDCLELMSFKTAQEGTLLRGNPLINYKFECNICGYSSARIVQDEG